MSHGTNVLFPEVLKGFTLQPFLHSFIILENLTIQISLSKGENSIREDIFLIETKIYR